MLSLLPLMVGLLSAEPETIASALNREIIGPRQTMAEVQDFAESRVPKMPEVKSADEWTAVAEKLRADTLNKVIFRGEAAAWRDAKGKVERLDTIEGGPGYCIKKLRFEAVPGLWVPALLYEPEVIEGNVPVVLNVNGHDGNGKAADYKQIRCINLAKRGIVSLNLEWFGMGQLKGDGFRHGLINAIDLCGTSGVAVHYLAMKRGLDILLDHDHADPKRVGVTGLSGGGWQTIFFSPLETRVTLTNPVAGYSSFRTRARHLSDLGDSEQTPSDLATVVDYAHLTAMMAPRPTLLTFNAKDNCCFAAGHALPPLLDAATPIFKLYDKEKHLRSHVNEDPGDHNYGLDNRQAFYKMLGDSWYEGDTKFDPKEIPSEKEVKKADELKVELPGDNLDLNKLAVRLSESLPRSSGGDDPRMKLRSLVRPFGMGEEAKPTKVEDSEVAGADVTYWKLRVADTWTVPAVEFARGETKGSVILIADAGRKEMAKTVEASLEEGKRVVVVDPFYFGESKVKEKDYLFALLVATVGERPLGIQVGQVAAIARWHKAEHGDVPTIVAVGPRSSAIALIAAALELEAIGGVELHEPLGSLKELIEQGKDYTYAPELFCFGLLAEFDLKRIAALVAPRPVELVKPSERAEEELGR